MSLPVREMIETVKLKTFTATVKCQLGWGYVDAFVAIRFAEESLKNSFLSENCKGDYVLNSKKGVIEYQGNFWLQERNQLDGLESRPLTHETYVDPVILFEKLNEDNYKLDNRGKRIPTGKIIEGYYELTDLFLVDLDHHESLEVLGNDMLPHEKMFELVRLDVIRNFK